MEIDEDKAKRREKPEEAAADSSAVTSPSGVCKNSDGVVVELWDGPGGWWEQSLGGRSITRQTGWGSNVTLGGS